MKKDLFGIMGVLISVVGFTTYYIYAYFHYNPLANPPLNQLIGTLNYIPLMLGLSLMLIQLTINSTSNAKYLIYGIGAVIWSAVAVTYFFKDVVHLIESKAIILPFLLLCIIFGLVLYAYKSLQK